MTAAPTPAPRQHGPATRPALVAAAIGLVALLIGGTLALWSATAGFRGGEITAGDLDLTTGTATWQQVTPGVTDPRSGVLDGVPEDFFTMPGDVIEIVQPITTTLIGDNLAAGLSVGLADAEVVDDVDAGRITVSYRVEDAHGMQVAPASGQAQIGDVLAVPGLTGTDDGVTTEWVLVVRVEVLDDYVWTGSPVTAAAGLWSADTLQITLEQTRTGDGFVGASAPAATVGGAR